MSKISAEKIREIIESHGKWLRNEQGGSRADLSGADLSGADLRSAYLRSADLSGADLSGADLSGADLSGADLRSADLRSAYLRSADLSGADLRSAYLRSADLSGADLSGADLRSADLSGADLSGADLSGADLDKRYIQVACIGSRKGTTTYCFDDDIVLCGCWNNYKGGTLEEFEQRVRDVYGDMASGDEARYYKEYMGFVEYVKSLKGGNEA